MNINLGKLDIVVRFIVGVSSIVSGGYMAFALDNVYGLALGLVGAVLAVTRVVKMVSDVCASWIKQLSNEHRKELIVHKGL